MRELRQCEFFLLRYVPDAVKDEFVNLGVVLLDAAGEKAGARSFAEFRFTTEWSRVRCIDPDADIEMLQALESEIRSQLAHSDDSRELLLKKITDSFSNTVQLSGMKGCLTESPQAEIETLARHYLQTPASRRARSERGAGARLKIAAEMKRSFEEKGVWELMMKKIAASDYTAAGDPLKIDCGYKPNGVVRMFHAVPLKTNSEAAKVLAFSYPQIKAGMEARLHARAELTAIVEDDLERDNPEIRFGLSTLERSEIGVAAVSQMGKIAERARLELKA